MGMQRSQDSYSDGESSESPRRSSSKAPSSSRILPAGPMSEISMMTEHDIIKLCKKYKFPNTFHIHASGPPFQFEKLWTLYPSTWDLIR